MWKIALSGMKGRKKDTLLLSVVITLSFIFIITSTILHESSEQTKLDQRIAMFGSWDTAYLKGNESIHNELSKLEDINKLGASRIIGNSETLGTVGTINKELEEIGYFQMYEGRMPENENEIAIEVSQLGKFPKEIKVGDIIPVEIKIGLFEKSEGEINKEAIYSLIPRYEEILALYGEKVNIAEEIENYEKSQEEARRKAKEGVVVNFSHGPSRWIEEISMYMQTHIRNERNLENFDNTLVITKIAYHDASLMEWVAHMDISYRNDKDVIYEEIRTSESRPIMMSQEVYIVRDMVVSGIIQTYSDIWNVGDSSVANSFITEAGGEKFLENGLLLTKKADISNYEIPINLFIESHNPPMKFYNSNKTKFDGLTRNTLSYPDEAGSKETTFTYGILAAIFIVTIGVIFQIYLTQIKRRTRKIALLKAIGATVGQTVMILLWEVFYTLLLAIPIGIGLGPGISRMVIFIMNNYGKAILNFHINYRLTGFGVIVGTIAVFIGMVIPMIVSLKIPLTGTISEPPKHKKARDRKKGTEYSLSLDIKLPAFERISINNILRNKRKYILTAGLYTTMTVILLGSIFLCFIFFGDYIDKVIVKDRPSYGLELDYGMKSADIPQFVEELKDIDGVSRVELYKAGERAYFWYEGIEDNPLFSTFKEVLPMETREKHFGINDLGYSNLHGKNTILVKDGIVSNVYGIDVEDFLYNRFEKAIDIGLLDKEKFASGEEVIVMMPIYKEIDSNDNSPKEPIEDIILNTNPKNRIGRLLKNNNLFNITYDFRYKHRYIYDDTLKAGDTIHIMVPEDIGQTKIVSNKIYKTRNIAFNEAIVSGIIYYFPEKGIWPFADTIENPVIIGSYRFVEKLYPSIRYGLGRLSVENVRDLVKRAYPTKFGKTWVYVYAGKNIDDVKMNVELKRMAREKSFKLVNYKEGNQKIFNKSFNISAIIAILGAFVGITIMFILYNSAVSELEQERGRIGIFQALGVTGEEFSKVYLFTGLGYGLISLVASHVILAIGVLFMSIGIGRGKILWLYPWSIHIALSIIVFAVIVMTYYLPIRKILKHQPIYNIEGLSR